MMVRAKEILRDGGGWELGNEKRLLYPDPPLLVSLCPSIYYYIARNIFMTKTQPPKFFNQKPSLVCSVMNTHLKLLEPYENEAKERQGERTDIKVNLPEGSTEQYFELLIRINTLTRHYTQYAENLKNRCNVVDRAFYDAINRNLNQKGENMDKIENLILKKQEEFTKMQKALDSTKRELGDYMHMGATDAARKLIRLVPKVISHMTGGKGTLHSVFVEIGEVLETISKLDTNYLKEFSKPEPYDIKLSDDVKYFANHLFTNTWTANAKLVDVLEKLATQKRVPNNPFHEGAKHVKKT